MKKYIYIGFLGTLGAILRYIIEHITIFCYQGNIPINTLTINIIGSFILSLILTISYEIIKLNDNIKLSITTGFLGAFTTFSTMCKEIFNLINTGYFYEGILYTVFSAVIGLGVAYLGSNVARDIGCKLVFKKYSNPETASDYEIEEGDE